MQRTRSSGKYSRACAHCPTFDSQPARYGGCWSIADGGFPALLLDRGHWHTLLMGYQIGFALVAVLAIGLIAHVVRAAEPGERRVGLWAGLWLAGLALQGGFGLAFVPPVGLWIGDLAVRRGRAGGPGAWVRAGGALAAPALSAPPTA